MKKAVLPGDDDKMSDYLHHQDLKLSTVKNSSSGSSGTRRESRVRAANVCQPKITLGGSNTFRQRKQHSNVSTMLQFLSLSNLLFLGDGAPKLKGSPPQF